MLHEPLSFGDTLFYLWLFSWFFVVGSCEGGFDCVESLGCVWSDSYGWIDGDFLATEVEVIDVPGLLV